MTARTLEEIEVLAAEATPGPWMLEEQELCPVGSVVTADRDHPIAQTQHNLTVHGSDYVAQNKMRNANGRLIAEVWRILAIAQEQRGAMAADEERTRAAAMRVWGDHVRGCDTADAMADLIVSQRAEIARLQDNASTAAFDKIADQLGEANRENEEQRAEIARLKKQIADDNELAKKAFGY